MAYTKIAERIVGTRNIYALGYEDLISTCIDFNHQKGLYCNNFLLVDNSQSNSLRHRIAMRDLPVLHQPGSGNIYNMKLIPQSKYMEDIATQGEYYDYACPVFSVDLSKLNQE